MREKREFRKVGELLELGGVKYQLESIIGYGGSSIVYGASYEDQLNCGSRHQVLIKELYPRHLKGLIYRDASGAICCEGDGRLAMERSRKSFYQGNQANLELLSKLPEKISGNLNSYESYGTFYSILTVHGGRSLEELLTEGSEFNSLKKIAEGILKILDAVDCFHRNRILHLDISPDNILILPERAMLIDYNSIWQMDNLEDNCFFSEKDGYTAPEVRLREAWDVGPASDLYSVCAVLFRMMTGRILSESEASGNGLKRCFPKDLDIFQGEPVSAARKAVQIITKGLHVLARKRYQSADELRAELQELLLRIEGKGISHSAVWEGSRRDWKRQSSQKEPYQPRRLAFADSGRQFTQEECYQHLEQGQRLLLTGAGGMGKTRLLRELWGSAVKDYFPSRPVVIYIPLAGYQEAVHQPGGEGCYIRKYILRSLWFWDQVDGMEDGLHELERLMDQEDGLRLILLLDGLNEAGSRQNGLIKEIETLGAKPGIGILVTDRSDAVCSYGLQEFSTAELLPFSESTVREILERTGIDCPADQKLLSLLQNPMLLSLYRKTVELSKENGFMSADLFDLPGLLITSRQQPSMEITMEGMVGRYLESLLIHEKRVDSGNQAEQLRHQYLLQHFLPEIAGELKRRKKTLLTTESLYHLAEKNYQNLSRKSFSLAFPEFLGKSRLMMQEIHNEKEWFDYAVTEQLTGHFNLMERSRDGNYRLVHDNFLDYLAEEERKKRQKELTFQKKEWRRRGAAGFLLAVALTLAGVLAWSMKTPRRMTKEQQNALSDALKQMDINLGALAWQISAQNDILKTASADAVLEGREEGIRELEQYMEYQNRQTKQKLYSRGEKKDVIKPLENLKVNITKPILQDLYTRTFEMDNIMEEAQKHLQEKLCDGESVYIGRDKREPLVKVYEDYLEAYAEYVYRELNCLMIQLDETNLKEVRESVSYMPVFQQYLLQYPMSNLSEQEAEEQMEQAKDNLRDAVREMKAQNYTVPGIR